MKRLNPAARWLVLLMVGGACLATAGAALGQSFYLGKVGAGGTWVLYEKRDAVTWTEANATASAATDPVGLGLTGRMPVVDSAAKNLFLAEVATAGSFWIGATDQDIEGTWTWAPTGQQFWQGLANGTPVGGLFANWNTGEPNDAGGEDYAELLSITDGTVPAGGIYGLWNDLPASYTRPVVIEYPTPFTTLPTPTLTETTGSLYVNPSTGTYYEKQATNMSWIAAKWFAEAHTFKSVQGKLAEVNDKAENFFLASLGEGYIGLTDSELFGGTEAYTDQTFGWVWSSPAGPKDLFQTGYYNWNDGEPNNYYQTYGGGEDYTAVYGSGKWNDYPERALPSYVEYETPQVVAKGFLVRAINDMGTGTGGDGGVLSYEPRRMMNGLRQAASLPMQTQLAAVNLGDQESYGGRFGGKALFPIDTDLDDENFAMKAWGTIFIEKAGTYTFGGGHDDSMELVIDRGADPAAAFAQGTGDALFTTTFAKPGRYNIYVVMGETGGGATMELAAAQGTITDYNEFVGAAKLVGDVYNGGLKVGNLRYLTAPGGFSIRDVRTTAGPLGSLANADALLDSGQYGASSTGETVNLRDATTATVPGEYGNDAYFNGYGGNDFAVEVLGNLVVPQGAGGWWTLGVNSDEGFRLTIKKDGSVVAFGSAAGTDPGSGKTTEIVNGSLQFNAERSTMDSFGSILLEPGSYSLILRSWGSVGSAALELYYAAGVHDAFNGAFDLLGTTYGYELQTEPPFEPQTESHPGDANRDGKVDDLDASILAANWQRTGGAAWEQADFNADGNVNDLDASILAANWQYGVGSAVPEPGTLVLLAGGLVLLLLARRRR